ncbi:PucR family transcriptional regulator [Streptomyces sp. YS-B37]|uniref:PucR family transcriptional regulator n=1 Tax=Streptomyces sp. YS-B37 TaxID=3407669 RepID=UPI003B50FA6C
MAADVDVQAMVDRLARRLRRSIAVNDLAVRPLYYSAHFGDEDAVRVTAVLRREADSGAVGYMLASGTSTWTTAGVVPANPELGMRARYCQPVRWRGEAVGLLVVIDADGTLTTVEKTEIKEVSDTVAALLVAQRDRQTTDPAVQELTVLDLISSDPVARRRATTELTAGDHAQRFTWVTAIALTCTQATENAGAKHVEVALRNAVATEPRLRRAAVLSAVGGGDMGLLLLGSRDIPDISALKEHATAMVKRSAALAAGRFSCAAGIGSTVPGLIHAVDSAAQARLACRAQAAAPGPVLAWSELGAIGPLLTIPADQLTPALLPHELQRLRAADPDGLLLQTVTSYLAHACSGPAAADDLHIHRTTLYYRLSKITELTGLDLGDGSTRLALHLGITMMALMDDPDRNQDRIRVRSTKGHVGGH